MQGGLSQRFKTLLLHVLCGSLALYPLLEQFVLPVLALSLGLVAVYTALGLVARGLRIPASFIVTVWFVLTFVYVTWFCIAMARGNTFQYITQDSLGFLLYFGILPVLYLYIHQNSLASAFIRFVEGCSIAISGASVALVLGFFLVFGSIESESLLLINAFLKGLGLSWTLDHNLGVLGLYTNTAHLVLLGNALALHRLSLRMRRKDLLLALLYLIAMVLDGRRALMITAALQMLIVAPRLMARLTRRSRLVLAFSAGLLLTALVAPNVDWLQQRFEFSDADVSSAERYAQIPALLDKITENPWLGGGFGTAASYIRSVERPYSYEVDFLATIMKLGLLGSTLYFGTYLYSVAKGARARGDRGLFYVSAGLPFFFYMSTNGNQAMSTDSAVFHILLLLLITLPLKSGRPPKLGARAVPGAQCTVHMR